MEYRPAAELLGLPPVMKTVFRHPPEDLSGKRYWRSLEELADTPEFRSWLERELPAGAAELELDGVSRRNFLRLMGASMALAGIGLSGCRRPEAYIVPYTKSVEWLVPGKAVLYTTSMPGPKGGVPLIATTFEGRPTKLEGNPLVPSSNGGTDLFAQASVLDLYDPGRARTFIRDGEEAGAQQFDAYLASVAKDLEATKGAGFAILMEEQVSPTRDRFLRKVKERFPESGLYTYNPLGFEEHDLAVAALFGPDIALRADFEVADVIVSLDSDFLGIEQTVQSVRDFSRRRRVHGLGQDMNRLYAVENRYTITGGMADHRFRCAASQIPAFAVKLAKEVAASTNDRVLNAVVAQLKDRGTPFDQVWIKECAADLVARKGKNLVLLGDRFPAWVHGVVLATNNALGAFGSTLRVLSVPRVKTSSLRDLVADTKARAIKRLFIFGGNPVYAAPADFEWGELQRAIPEVVRLGYWFDETSSPSKWHVPEAHYLESWGDQRAPDGTYLPIQPMILPLFGGLSQLDLLAKLAGLPAGVEAIRETFKTFNQESDFESAWTRFLRQGFAESSSYQAAKAEFNPNALPDLLKTAGPPPGPVSPGAIEIVFPADYKIYDGRYANNGWLQELPDPITKITWDNAISLSKSTAKSLQLQDGDLVEIAVNGRKLQAAVMIAPGHADYSLSLPLGYGRWVVGKVGQGTGFNAYALRTSDSPYFATGATVNLIQKNGHRLVQTQNHYSMEGRALVREATVDEFKKNPAFAKTVWMDAEIPPNVSLYSHPPLNAPNQWGMVVDLNTCIGCAACVIACQAENNIPIVGKDQVDRGREMHWIRVDRYFASAEGDKNNPHLEEDPEMVMEPMMCQHCENAPCETVCPVNATVHSEDGLNVMVYNRCIGTRYCSNNCPFKVRRFNFFSYNDRPVMDRVEKGLPGFQGKQQLYLGPLAPWGMDELSKMQKNPNVSVRIRGVMEKCTYCLQRIETAKISQRVKAGVKGDLSLPTDSVKTACQQACPAEAIVFGDIKDPKSKVSQLRTLPQNYHLLEYLNIQTRTTYLARIRNPNPKMPGAARVGNINVDEHGDQRHSAPRAESEMDGGNA
ncbi:MAG TPA: TAT-variant-translocated molybdopterin oxidoreductase [Chthoniobacterales bacterium]|jgi:molybdopterin-containing oxidoreductase family iron-sulfur binding subunit|nr:TAT-variant-translocated molybdopterin oxidoreductase [Chthoniobacterales bacterium]